MVDLIRFCLVSDEFLYMIGKRTEFLIDLYGCGATISSGYPWRIAVRRA